MNKKKLLFYKVLNYNITIKTSIFAEKDNRILSQKSDFELIISDIVNILCGMFGNCLFNHN